MKKTKFLTCLATLTILLAGCEVAAENLDSDTTDTESSDTTASDTGTGGDTGSGEGGDTGEGGGDDSGESRLGLLGEAFKLVGGANYTLTCYSTAVNTDDHLSYSGFVTSEGAISTSYTGSTTGMINDPNDGGFVEVTLDGDVLKASAAPDPTRSVQDYYISSNIDTALFEELDDGRFALKDEGFTSDVLGDLFPDKPFTGGLITPTQGTIFIEVEDDLSKVTYYYDSSFLGNYTVTLVVENLGTTVFPYDLSTQYVGVGSEDVTTWAAFLDSSVKASADQLLGADLDDVLPFYVVDGGYSYTGVMSGKFDLQWSGNLSGTDWVNELLTFGYTEVTANEEYILEGEEVNYTVTFSSFFGKTDLYLAPTEKPSAQEEPTTWSEYLAQNAGNNIDGEADINALLGAAIDEILPYVVPECGYNFITVDTTTGCVSFTLDNATYAASTLAEWESALIAFGYTDLGNLTYQNEAGYKVTLTDWTFIDMIYIYVYPPVAESEGPSSWADYFTDEYTQGVLNELFDGVALDDILPFYLEESGLTRCEPQPTLLRFNIEYYPEPSGLTETWVALLLEDGWTETGDESSNQGTTETISFEKDGYTISIVIERGYWDLYLYPRTTTGGNGDDEDLKTAQSILDVVTQTSYLDWDAFHGESVDDWEETISEYLTTDEDGNAYGYVVSSEDSNTYYYYGGYKCVYNQNGVAQTPGVSYLDYETELDDYSSPLLSAHSLNLSNVDSYEINELGDGYELVITNGASSNAYGYGTEYVYTVDSEFNLIALGQYGPENVASSDLVGSYAEKITHADVEEALAATSFNPADFGLGKTSAADQITAVVSKLTEIGSDFDYDSGFYYDNMELRPGDNLSAYYYDALTITATTDNRGYMSQSSMDILDLENTYYSYEYFSDGTDTYYYDVEDGQSKEDELYEFDTYQAMAEIYFSYMDFDQVCELIEASASVSDIEVDEDYEISDDTIYIYANNADYSLYYELDVEYDDDGLTYFSFSYMDDLYAYAVALTPAEYVDDPEWYVPDTGTGGTELTGWAAIIGEDTKAAADELLGADLDEIFPAIAPDGGYTYVYVRTNDFYVDYENYSDLDACRALEDEFVAALLTLGYTETGGDIYSGIIYTSDSYQVTVTDMFWLSMGSVSFAIQAL